MAARRGNAAHFLFVCAVAIKGFDGLLETIAGLLIAATGPQKIYALVLRYTTPELAGEGSHRLLHALQHGAAQFAMTSGTFAIVYFLVHGILKLAIAVELLRDRRWIYLPAVVILGGFVLFLSYRVARHLSWLNAALVLFDLFTLALVVNEWAHPRHRPPSAAA